MSRHSNESNHDRVHSSERDLNKSTRDEKSVRDEITGLGDDLEGSDHSSSDDEANGSNIDGYRFSLSNGKVTNLQEFDDGRWRTERIDSSESWSFDGTNLIKTETGSHGTAISSFGDLDGDGVFTRNNASTNPFNGGLGTSDISGLG